MRASPTPYYRRSARALDSLGSWSDFLHTAEGWLGKVSNAAGRVASTAEQVQNTANDAQAQLPQAYTIVRNPRAAGYGASTAARVSQFTSDHPLLTAGLVGAAGVLAWRHFMGGRR